MNDNVRALKSDLALLKLQFSEKIASIEARLDGILAQENPIIESDKIKLAKTQKVVTQQAPKETVPTEVTSAELSLTVDDYLTSRKNMEANAPSEPSFLFIFFKAIFSAFFDWFSPVAKIYQSYKTRGMLGIFILTIVGIGLTLAGFGYLMQLLIDQLGAGSKSLLMCFAAMLVMGLGIGLKIKTRFGEFATAIVTLGILLSYSTVYFSGSVYGILPNVVVLFSYLLIAVMCHVLALWLDTKVVAALGIIGIATMPILSNTVQIEPLYYLISLAFVAASSLILAYRHLGQWLAHLSLAFTLIAIEWIIGIESVHLSPWMINVFYLLFFAYVVMSLIKDKVSKKPSLMFLAALVGSTVFLFLQAGDLFSSQISITFVLNAVVAGAIASFFYKIRHELTHFLILLCTLWSVLAVVSALTEAYRGVAWAVEGLLLLYIGRKYLMSAVINQGQILTAIALIYSWSALALYFPLPALKSLDGWMLSIVIILVVGVWQRMINNATSFDELTRSKVKPFLQWLEAVWLSVLLIACANIWLGEWTGAIAILLQLALMFRAKYCKQVAIEIFASSLIIIPLYYAYSGALLVDSYRFMLLPLFAKFAVISAFAQLWLWSAFYRKYQPDSVIKNVAEWARIIFYMLIPVCWVGSSIRRLDENALMIIWLSPLLALFFAKKIKHHWLLFEAKILAGLASLSFIGVVGSLEITNTLVTLVGFSAFYLIAYMLHRKSLLNEIPDQLSQFICSLGIISLGIALPSIVGFQTNSLFNVIIIAMLYWASSFNLLNVSEHFKRNEIIITVMNVLLIITAWFMTFISATYAVIPAIFLMATLYQKEHKFKNTHLCKLLGLNGDLLLHSIVAITYITLFASLEQYRLDLLIAPVLAVHGALILFMKDRRIVTVKYSFILILLGIIKLAFIDAASALLWQKVMLFMGIGVFILAASFWYQKIISKNDIAVNTNAST